MSDVSPSELQRMCENTLKFMAETRPKHNHKESEVEKAIWHKRAEAERESRKG